MKYLNRLEIRLDSGFYILLAMSLLVIPLPWLLSWIIAAVIHEAGHMAAVICCGYTVERVNVGWRGAKIVTDYLGKSEWLCALAGPTAGLLLLLLIRVTPRLSICGVMQSVVNMLPVYPLDGGRLLKGLLQLVVEEEKAEQVTGYISAAVMFLLGCVLMGANRPCGFVCLILAILFAIRRIAKINIPCKRRGKWVQ